MKNKLLALILTVVMLSAFYGNRVIADEYNSDSEFLTTSNENSSDYVSYVVKMKTKADINGVTEDEVAVRLEDTAMDSQKSIIEFLEKEKANGNVVEYTSFYIVNSISVTSTRNVATEISKRNDVEKVVEDKEFNSEPKKEEPEKESTGYSLNRQTRSVHVPWNLKAIYADKARQEATGEGVVVGIIDSGVDFSHPAITSAWRGNDESLAIYSWYDATKSDFGKGEKPTDSTGHGTHVAGTILGKEPDTDSLLGIAPDAKWIAAKVFDEEGETTLSRLLAAGQWMLAPTDETGTPHPEMRPKIINNSWGGNSENEFYREMLKAWRNAGILPVFSAGNTSASNQGGEGSIGTPGAYPESFTVGALRRDDKIAAFSLRGPSKYKGDIKPDISAPGVNIRSSVPGGGYELRSGTSMAGPHVSGVAALVLSANPNLTPDEVENIITNTATKLTDEEYVKSPNFAYGYGKVNAYNAVKAAKGKDDSTKEFATLEGRLLTYGEDSSEPKINHVAIKTMYNVYNFNLEAKVNDDNGIENVKLFLAAKGSENFAEKEMELIKGTKISGEYSCTIEPTDLDSAGMKYYIEATDVTGKKLKTETYEADVKGGIGIGYKQDFEENVDGIVFGGKTPMWEWGVPKSGGINAASGSKVIATNLNGNYKGLKDTLMVLPAIDLSNETRNPALKFKHWYDLGNGEGAFFDTSEVWIGEIKPDSKTIDDVEYKNVRLYKNHSGKWEDEYIDLSAYKGKKILVMFGMRYAGWSKQEEMGWYIDDIAITEASDEIPLAPNKYVSLKYKNNGQIVYSFQPVKNEKINAYALYRSKEENGNYEKVTTVEKGSRDFGKYSITLSDYPLPQTGTYYYYAKALIGNNESEASEKLHHTFTTGKEVIKFDFENDDSWTSEEKDGAKWTKGVIQVIEQLPDNKIGSKPVPNNSKGKNKNSDTVWGTELDDFRKANKEYTLVSPNMNLSNYSKLGIYLQMWFNTAGRKGRDEWGTYDDDIGEIFISKDGGENWESFFKLDEKAIDKSNRIKGAWYLDNLDDKEIPTEYLTDKFRVKFVLSTGSDIADSNCGGWYIDDFAIYDKSDEGKISPDNDENVSNENDITSEVELRNDDEVFELSNMSLYSNDTSSNTLVPVKGEISIKETGISVNSESGTGRYSFLHEAGDYTLVATAKGYKAKEISVSLNSGAKLNTDIILEKSKGSKLSFEVRDKEEKLIENAVIRIFRSNNYSLVKTLNGAKQEINDLEYGNYKLLVSAEGFKNYSKEIEVKDEEDIDLGIITLSKRKENENSTELYYDDGNAESVPNNMADGKTLGVRFETLSESKINSVSFMFVNAASNTIDTAGKEFIYSIYAKNDKDAYPTEIIFGPQKAKVDKENQWTTVKLPEEVQTNGEFFVAYTQVGEGNGTPQLGIDDNNIGAGKSFKLINGAWNEPSEKGSFMIRVNVSEVTEDKEPKKPDTPKPEEPKQPDIPKPEEPKQPDTPKPEEPKQPDKPRPEEPKQPDMPKPEEPKQPDTPKPEEPKQPDTPKPEEPKQPDMPKPEKPKQPEIPNTEEPKSEKSEEKEPDRPMFTKDYGSLKIGTDGEFVAGTGDTPNFSFVKKNGEKVTGRQKFSFIEDGKTVVKEYFFDENGNMQSGWKYDEKTASWYYLSSKKDKDYGSMQKGWVNTDNNSYFLDYETGQMAVGYKYINGKLYHFNESHSAAERGFIIGVNDWFLSVDKPYGALLEK